MKKAHFVGICGVGMSAMAMILKEKGWKITGSDEGCHPPISTYLSKKNISVSTKYSADQISKDLDLIVAGGNAKLKPGDNAELNKARKLGIDVKTFPEVLGETTKDTKNILAVGSYGKSTCTALLAWCLEYAGKDPGYFIGALPIGMDVHGKNGKGEVFVLEGDEYPTSSIDSRAKFLHIKPHTVLLTSGEHDHVNVYPTLEDYLKPFAELLGKIPADGRIVACLDNPNVEKLIAAHKEKTVTYGLLNKNNPSWTAQDIKREQITSFTLVKENKKICELQTTLLGDHNIQNIVGVSALLLEENLLDKVELQEAIKNFRGIERRLDLKTEKSSVLAYEGFGSSRKKALSAISAVKHHFPSRRLVVLFEPHTFSWRNKSTIHWYDDVFIGSDKVFIYKPPQTKGITAHEGEEKYQDEQLSQKDIVERVRSSGVDIEPVENSKNALEKLHRFLKPDDILLILTSGHFEGLLEKLPKELEKWFPRN